MKHIAAICIGLFSIAVLACEGKSMKELHGEQKAVDPGNTAIQGFTMDKKVFFGHQSVGQNILEGIDLLTTEIPVSRVDTRKTTDLNIFEKPGITHAQIGENGEPLSKYEEFKTLLDSGIGDRVDIAGMKLCYLDISGKTDVQDLFDKYKATVNHIKNRHTKLKIIHIATPLTVKSNPVKDLVKKIIGKENIWGEANRNRVRYNDLLRAEYKHDTVFNLDMIEAAGDDSPPYKTIDNNYSLDQRFASDWGHLNDLGKKTVAGKFLKFLESAGK